MKKIIGALISLGVAWLLVEQANAWMFEDWQYLHFRGWDSDAIYVLTLALLFAAYWLQVIVHEAGHLVFGLLTGYKFASFRIGSILLMRKDGKLRLKRKKVRGTAGQCLMEPPEMVDGRTHVVLYHMGGVILNLAAGAAALALWYVIGFEMQIFGVVPIFLMNLVWINLYAAIMNGIPWPAGVIRNDGRNLLSICKNPGAKRAVWIQLSSYAAMLHGEKLTDMPAEWFVMPDDEEMRNEYTAWLGLFALDRMMEERRFEDADKLVRHFLEIKTAIQDATRAVLVCERMRYEMLFGGDMDALNALRSKRQLKLMKAMKKNFTVISTEYIHAVLIERDAAKAAKLKERFERVVGKHLYPQLAEVDRELMQLADQRAEKIWLCE